MEVSPGQRQISLSASKRGPSLRADANRILPSQTRPATTKSWKNALCYASWDKFLVCQGHLLVVPYREFADYSDATPDEKAALWALVDAAKRYLDELHHPDGYNIGINIGEAAGQTVTHMHSHVIPR